MKYNKSTLFLFYHTALPQFVSLQSNFVQSRIYVSFLNKSTDLKSSKESLKLIQELRAQGSQSGIYITASGHCEAALA